MKKREDSHSRLDPVRPGEQWFFYWKTSAALWEGKILESPAHEVIYIPLYWGFHQEAPGQWDFGSLHPERDLQRLTSLLLQHRRKFCWILPLTPAPFCPNGGVPVAGALTLSIAHDGAHIACLDQEKKLNKMFSFFEPKVFNHYSGFVRAFGEFLSQNKIQAPCWGAIFSYGESGKKWSYLYDRSHAFESGFSRYLKKNSPSDEQLSSGTGEEKLRNKYTVELQELFSTTAETMLSPFWMGVQDVIFVGGSPRETLERGITEGKNQNQYFRDIFFWYVRDQFVSTALLGADEKNQLLPYLLSEHFGAQEIDIRFHYQAPVANLGPEMKPFGLVDIFDQHNGVDFARTGLLNFLEKKFPWMYQIHDRLNFTTEWIEANYGKVKFFHGQNLDRVGFGQMIKLFLMGQQIVLDRTGLDPELDKKLQIFYLENSLQVQAVNFVTNINLTTLGEGRFITFDGAGLYEQPDREKFWTQIFKFLSLSQPETMMDEDVFGLWRIRAASQTDLNYLDVRRVNLYNPTSYKKRVNVRTKKHFAFMRMVDQVRADAKSTPEGVEVEILPFGKIALDFGHYEEL